MKLHDDDEDIQERTLLTGIGTEAKELYTFVWNDTDDAEKIQPVLELFRTYREPRKNIPFKRYCFNQRAQQLGETYDQYKTALKKLAEGCDFANISDEILSDRLVFGIRDHKVRECLLWESSLTLLKTELCPTAERMVEQLKFGDMQGAAANAVSTSKKASRTTEVPRTKEQPKEQQLLKQFPE